MIPDREAAWSGGGAGEHPEGPGGGGAQQEEGARGAGGGGGQAGRRHQEEPDRDQEPDEGAGGRGGAAGRGELLPLLVLQAGSKMADLECYYWVQFSCLAIPILGRRLLAGLAGANLNPSPDHHGRHRLHRAGDPHDRRHRQVRRVSAP